MKPDSTWKRKLLISFTGVVLLAVCLVALNVAAGFFPARMDVTDEGLFTLSEGSENILESLKEPAVIKFYFTENLPSVSIGT